MLSPDMRGVAVETQLSQEEAAALAKPATAGLFPLREPPRRYGGDRRASLKRQKPRSGETGVSQEDDRVQGANPFDRPIWQTARVSMRFRFNI